MNQRQKSILRNVVFVFAVTAIFVAAMVNVKDLINKSEAIRAMELLAQQVTQYRAKNHSTPPESYLLGQYENLGIVRLGDLNYRAQWISYESEPGTILAYAKKNYQFLVKRGYVVMFLDGRVEWMRPKEFKKLLKEHQTQAELDILQKLDPTKF